MSNLKQFLIQLASLPAGITELDFTLDGPFFAAMENAEVLDAQIDAQVDIENKNSIYHVTLDLQGWLSVACDRCLDPMRVPVDTVYELKVKYGYEFDDSTEGLLILPENQPDLDLAPLLYDTAILSIPMRCVHPEGECNKAMSELLEEHDLQDADVSDADDEIPDPDRN